MLRVLQINIKSWRKYKYNLSVELSNHNPDVILLNELSIPNDFQVQLNNYHSISQCQGNFTGVSILIRNNLSFQEIPFIHEKIIAIKVFTNTGPIIISTAYIPPRDEALPTIQLNKIFNFNIPTIFIGDLNAHHPTFNNSPSSNTGDTKGRQLVAIIRNKNLSFLGPNFNTFLVKNRKGKPDLILCNNSFNIFHHFISPGKPVGSDHIPIIISIQVTPFKLLKTPKPNLNKLDINKYKATLENDIYPSLDLKPITELDVVIEKVYNQITNATSICAPKCNIIVIKNYLPSPRIKRKLEQYQAAYLNHCQFGFPPTNTLSEMLLTLTNLVETHQQDNWKI